MTGLTNFGLTPDPLLSDVIFVAKSSLLEPFERPLDLLRVKCLETRIDLKGGASKECLFSREFGSLQPSDEKTLDLLEVESMDRRFLCDE